MLLLRRLVLLGGEHVREAVHGGVAGGDGRAEEPHRTELFDEYYSGRVAGKLNPSDVVDIVRRAMPFHKYDW